MALGSPFLAGVSLSADALTVVSSGVHERWILRSGPYRCGHGGRVGSNNTANAHEDARADQQHADKSTDSQQT